jgi:hypothetical protein
VRNGILEKLINRRVISYDESDAIRSKRNRKAEATMLINAVKTKTCRKFDGFLKALLDDEQAHIYNYAYDVRGTLTECWLNIFGNSRSVE